MPMLLRLLIVGEFHSPIKVHTACAEVAPIPTYKTPFVIFKGA